MFLKGGSDNERTQMKEDIIKDKNMGEKCIYYVSCAVGSKKVPSKIYLG